MPISNDGREKVTLLWKKICYLVEKYSVKYLQKNYKPLEALFKHSNLGLRRNFILVLKSIYVLNTFWEKYKAYQLDFLQHFNCLCCVESSCLYCCLKLVIHSIYEDELLTFLGCFHPCIITQSKILETYVDFIDEKFHTNLQLIEECFLNRRDYKEILIFGLDSDGEFSHAKACITCFFQKRIALELESAVYCIKNNYATDSVWTAVLIGSIIKMVDRIQVFEDHINMLHYRTDPIHHSHGDEIECLMEGSNLVLPAESPEQSPFFKLPASRCSNKNLSQIESGKLILLQNWRSSLVENGYLSKLQKSLQMDVENTVKQFLENEKQQVKRGEWKDLITSSNGPILSSDVVQINCLLQSTLCTIQALEKYLPVLLTPGDSFSSFKSSFYHVLETYVVHLIKHIKDISSADSKSFVMYFEYIALNNAIFIRDRLQFYFDILKDSVSKNKNNTYYSANQLSKELTDSIYFRHFHYISCGIFFEADSNKFEDPKPFFEGERISYSIQTWNLYMKGLEHDLTYFLPHNVAKELYTKTLSFSLEHFLIRYSSATPSEARTPQLSCDLYALLLCASELLWPACSSVSQYIGKKHELEEGPQSMEIDQLHSSCCLLLAVFVVLAAPLHELHKSLKDGFLQVGLSARTKYEAVAPWLPWIRPELFSEFCHGQIVSKVSVWLAVKANIYLKPPNPAQVVKAFIEHNCTLSILLMMQAANNLYSINQNNVPSITEDDKIALSYSLFELLTCYSDYSHLQDILLPVIESTNGWLELDISASRKPVSERSWWYIGLLKSMKTFFISVFEEQIPVWLDVSTKCGISFEVLSSLKDCVLNHVVCVCEKDTMNPLQNSFEISEEATSYVCLKKVLESMQRNVVLLPHPLMCFLLSLDIHILNYIPETQLFHQSLPLQVLLTGMLDIFQDTECTNKLTDDVKRMVLIIVKTVKSLLIEPDFSFVNEGYTKSLAVLFSTLHSNFSDLKKSLEKNSEPIQMKEIKDEVVEITVHKLLQLPHGEHTILYLHQILCQNETWFRENLGVPELLSPDVSPLRLSPLLNKRLEDAPRETLANESVSFGEPKKIPGGLKQVKSDNTSEAVKPPEIQQTVFRNFLQSDQQKERLTLNLKVDNIISTSQFNFNPFDCFEKLGESTFSQLAVKTPALYWESVLSHLPVLGLTEVNFRTLLSHRWDVRNEGPLTNEELKYVEELKILYKI